MWAAATLGIVAGVLLAASVVIPARSSSLSAGRIGVRIERGTVEAVWATHDVTWTTNRWSMSASGRKAAVMNWSDSAWRPNLKTARMIVGGSAGSGTLITLDAAYVPLWPWVVGPLGIAGMLWWRLPRMLEAGSCAACGYDIRGIRGEKCPECGGIIARWMAKWGMRLPWGGRACARAALDTVRA